MTIDNLLLQFNESDIREIRDNVPGKTFVIFEKPQYIGDCDVPIFQFIAMYDKLTKKVQAIKIYGLNMLEIVEYIQRSPTIFHCDVWHYLVDTPPQSLILFVS